MRAEVLRRDELCSPALDLLAREGVGHVRGPDPLNPLEDAEVDPSAAMRIVDFIKTGGSAYLLVPPVIGENKHVQRSGLESVGALIGVDFGQDFILETDTALRLPRAL